MSNSHLNSAQKQEKILIHVLNFFPEMTGCGKYAGELAFSLAKQGWEVEVVTSPPHYPTWAVEPPYKAFRYLRESIRGVRVLRCPILTRRNAGGLWRALAPLTFAVFAAPAVFWRIVASRPDVVLCVEPTLFSTPAALLASKLIGARTVLHVQDLEVDAAFEVGHLKGDLWRKAAMGFERLLLRSFDLTVTISRKMREALLRKGATAERTVVIRNWVDINAVHPLATNAGNRYRDALGFDRDAFVTLYSGQMGRKQALHVVLEAAALCQDDERLKFVIAGEGPVKRELVEKYGNLPNVAFLPFQPVDQFNELLNLANLHALPQLKNTADLVLPSKLGGMLASGRPVVATVEPDTELGEMLSDVAFIVPPEEPFALAAAIRKAASQDLREISRRGRQLAMHLSDKLILPAFAAALAGNGAGVGEGVREASTRSTKTV